MPINFNFQPIYQRYVGDNSDLVNRILTKKEEEYKLGEEYLDFYNKLQKGMEAAEPLTGQVEAVNNLRLEALNNIKQFTEQGDYENIYNKIKTSAVDMQGKYMPYAQQLKSFQEGLKEKKKNEADWGVYSDLDIQKQIEEYNKNEGLKIDPSTGQATGFFQFKALPKYYNVQKEITEYANKIPLQTTKTQSGLFRYTNDPNSDFYYYDATTGVERRIKPFEKIAAVAKEYLSQSPELLQVVEKQSNLDAYKLRKYVTSGLIDPESAVKSSNNLFDAKINAYKSLITELKDEKDPLKRKNLEEKYKSNIAELESYKINEDDFNSNSLENKLFNAYIERKANLTGLTLEQNDLLTETKFHSNEIRKTEIIDGIKKKQADADATVSATGNTQITSENIGKVYKNINDNLEVSKNNFNNNIKKILTTVNKDNTILQNQDIIADELNKLDINNGLNDEKVIAIANIFNKYGKTRLGVGNQFLEQTKQWVTNNLSYIKSMADFKNSYDESVYEKTKLDSYFDKKIGNNKITKYAKENNLNYNDAHNNLLNAMSNNMSIKDIDTRLALFEKAADTKTLQKSVEYQNLIKLKKAKKFIDTNDIPTKFDDYSELNFAFTNPKEGSVIHDENKKLTTHFQNIGLNNLTINGVSLQDYMNDGLTPEGKQNEKVVPESPMVEAASISNNNKILLKLKDKNNEIFYVNVDADDSNGNLYNMHLDALKKTAKSTTSDEKVRTYATSAIADDIIKKSDWGKIINLPNGQKRNITSKNGDVYIIGKGVNGNSFTLTNLNGQPLFKNASTIFGSLDDLKLTLGMANIY